MDSENTIARARDLYKSPSEKLLALRVELYPYHDRIPTTAIPLLMCTLLLSAHSFFVRGGRRGGGCGGNGAALVLIPPHRSLAIPAFLLAKLHQLFYYRIGLVSWLRILERSFEQRIDHMEWDGTDGKFYISKWEVGHMGGGREGNQSPYMIYPRIRCFFE